ncbi:MAG: hypothetical protein RH862_18700 [Leptospiraceae bacterium]
MTMFHNSLRIPILVSLLSIATSLAPASASPWSLYLGGGGSRLQFLNPGPTDLETYRSLYFLDQIERQSLTEPERTFAYIWLNRNQKSRRRSLDASRGLIQMRYSQAGDPWSFRIGYRSERAILDCTECSEAGGIHRWLLWDEIQKGNRDPVFLLYAAQSLQSQGGSTAQFDLLEFGWTYHFRRNKSIDPFLGLTGLLGTCRVQAYSSDGCYAEFAALQAGLRLRASELIFLEIEVEQRWGLSGPARRTSATGLNLGLSFLF